MARSFGHVEYIIYKKFSVLLWCKITDRKQNNKEKLVTTAICICNFRPLCNSVIWPHLKIHSKTGAYFTLNALETIGFTHAKKMQLFDLEYTDNFGELSKKFYFIIRNQNHLNVTKFVKEAYNSYFGHPPKVECYQRSTRNFCLVNL